MKLLKAFGLIAIGFIFVAAKHPASTCEPDLATSKTSSAEEALRARLAKIQPFVKRQGSRATLEWSGIRASVEQKSRAHGEDPATLNALTVSIFINGEEKISGLPFATSTYTIAEEPRGQVDYYIVYKRGAKIVHISEFSLKETTDGQNLAEGSFRGRYAGELLGFELTSGPASTGIRPELTSNALALGKKKIVWILSERAEPVLKEFIASAPKGVDVRAEFGADGEPGQVLVTDRASGARVEAGAKDFFFKVDAAFNGNSFFWDDMLVALATVPAHPWLARSTIEFWLMVQEKNGGTIPREVRKENLLSLWFPETIKYGEEPKPNLTYTNPYLMNWVMDELFRFDPSEKNTRLLDRVAKSMETYASWMEKHRAVRDQNGKLIGFNGSALGSGADNSRGRVGNAAEANAFQTAFIDFISQQAAMYNDIARWSRVLATRERGASLAFSERASRASSKAAELKKLINEKYWNEDRGYYFDLVPDGFGGWSQNRRFTPIAGFWALYAGAASPAQVQRLIETQLRPEAFGGEFPLPANSRFFVVEGRPTDSMYIPRDGFENEDGYWDKWAHWPPMMAVAIEGFRRSGRPDVAYDLAQKVLKKIAEWSTRTVEESYGEHRVNGELMARALQHASHPHRPDFAGWGLVPPVYVTYNHFLGFRPTYQAGRVDWDLRTPLKIGDSLTLRHTIYLGQEIRELKLTRISETRLRIESAAAMALDLKITHAGRESRIHLSSGQDAQEVELQ